MMKRLYPLLLAAAAMLSSCGSTDSDKVSPAAERGRSDAEALCTDSATLSHHALTAALLAVRSREWQMRTQGFDEDADAYIGAFRQYITDHNESLAKELF